MVDAQEDKLLNYANFRQFLEKISFKKEQLNEAINKKREYFNKYREAFKQYNELLKKEDTLRSELIEMIPKRF